MIQRVRPINNPLTDKDTVWEYLLMKQGWNNLPEDKQVGTIVKSYNHGDFYTVDVLFEELNYVAEGIFLDELVPVTDGEDLAPHS